MAERKVGFAYDERFSLHKHPTGSQLHPEVPERAILPYQTLKERGVLEKLVHVPSREATDEELLTVTENAFIEKFKNAKYGDEYDLFGDFDRVENIVKVMSDHEKHVFEDEKFGSYFNQETTYDAARLSAGSTLSLVEACLDGRCDTGFALVRPPGHHAGASYAGGFCFFNNVAVAARHAQKLGAKKVMVVDWDVHHGNGTQDIFYGDDTVLYTSIHRDYAYPVVQEKGAAFIGEGKGKGYNVNVALAEGKMGEKEYKLAFEQVILPVARKFQPDVILVSCGFDAARGDPIGHYDVTINTYGWMTQELLKVGKTIVVYEGGYLLDNLREGVYTVVKTLLGERQAEAIEGEALESAKENVEKTKQCHKGVWF